MKSKELLKAIGNIDDKMILEAASHSTRKKLRRRIMVPIAACFTIAALVGTGHFLSIDNYPQIAIQSPASDAPMGIRKVLNYNGLRYEFMENGASVKIDGIKLGEELGEITNDLSINQQSFAQEDFSASFAVGGKIYSVKGYDKDFRVAVLLGNNTYICESVDKINGDDVNLKEYFKTAKLMKRTKEIEVYDHAGRNLLTTFKGTEKNTILNGVTSSVTADLTNEDYETIGKMQKQGKSFFLHCKLKDGSSFKFYLIPDLGIAMLGDNRYEITEDFQNTSLDLFKGLQQEVNPMQ